MTYDDAIQFLYSLRLLGTKLGLENTRRLASAMGDPQDQLLFIHVAGTNGKGSVCAMLESIYRASGLRTGLFTSPHLVSFGERIQVNRQPISQTDVARLVDALVPPWHAFPPDHRPTFFEFVTIMALQYFHEQRCGLVIWETGMGGRFDATNIVTPLVSVITNIGWDHQHWLGQTLEQIASEKAGIIKPGVPVITAAREPDALRVFHRTAHQAEAPLTVVDESFLRRPPCHNLELSLLGKHQRWNAAVAAETVRELQSVFPVSEPVLRQALQQTHWPGRLQRIERGPGRTLLLDGAHNPDGCQALCEALDTHFPGQPVTLVLGVLEDKNWRDMCRLLAPRAAAIHLVPVASLRSARPERLLPACRQANPLARVTAHASLALALDAVAADPLVVLCGSLYLVGQAMESLHLSALPATDEKVLNDWTTPGAG